MPYRHLTGCRRRRRRHCLCPSSFSPGGQNFLFFGLFGVRAFVAEEARPVVAAFVGEGFVAIISVARRPACERLGLNVLCRAEFLFRWLRRLARLRPAFRAGRVFAEVVAFIKVLREFCTSEQELRPIRFRRMI